jgi:hypothetical protein
LTGWDWETVLDQMTWPRFGALRARQKARADAQLRAQGGVPEDESSGPPMTAEQFEQMWKTTGGRV